MYAALLVACLLFAAPASASTLRLTPVADTSFRPGVQDDTAVPGDTFILELWVNATDTDVNGAEATLQFDGAQLELLESAKASDSFPQASGGVNSDEDHSVFGDVLANDGLAPGTGSDTGRYAALTGADSARIDARLVRFLFQVRSTATQGMTYVTFRSTLSETTAVTAAETTGRNVLTATDTGTIQIAAGNDTHAVFTLVAPGSPEHFTIYNPTTSTIDLSKYYVSDDDSGYISASTASRNAASGDFIAHFPAGATLAAGETITVALSSDSFHATFPGVKVNYELNPDGAADGVTDLIVDDTTGVVELLDAGEVLILFQWDGVSDRVKDVDILVWGTGTAPNKTGKQIDGVDGDAIASTYFGDSVSMTAAAAPAAGQVLLRTNFILGDTGFGERKTGGNGIYGHDETSESCALSWAASSDSDPWHTMAVAYRRGGYASATVFAGETRVEALSFVVKGARGGAENLVRIDVRTLGTADTANIDTVSLFIDVDGDSLIGATDTFVANLVPTSATSWRYTGALALPATSGYPFMLGLSISSIVQTGETVQLTIDSQGIKTSVADSSSFIAITNAAALTLSRIVIRVETVAAAPAVSFQPGDTGVTILAARIRGNGADTLTSFAIANGGQLDDTDVDLFMWRDADSSGAYSAPDVYIGALPWSITNSRWETSGIAVSLPSASGDTFIFTLSASATANIEGDSFRAVVPINTATGVVADTGPISLLMSGTAQTLANPPSVANHVVIAAAYPDAVANDAAGEWLVLYNPTDTPQNLQNWTLKDNAATFLTFADTTIAARGWYLITDAGFVPDNPSWPTGDITANLAFNNTNDGVSLFDSTGVVIDRFGFGTASPDQEGTSAANPGTNLYDIYVRKPHVLSVLTDILWGGRDEFGGGAYDSYDNATDFIRFNGTDTNSWTLRNAASTGETPARKTTVAKIFTNVGSASHMQSETGVTAAVVFIQGDTATAGNLTAFRVEATDPIEDTNFTSVRLYEDANANSVYDTADTLVATLLPTGGAAWETSGISYGFSAYAGETFLVVLNLADTVTNGETFQARIAVRTVKASGADSGPSLVRTNTGILTLTTLNPLVITKHADIANDTVAPTADSLTVIAFRLRGNPAGDTLTRFTISNAGAMDTGDITQVQLFADANGDSRYSAGDTFVSTLTATSSRTWTASGLSTLLGTGLDFVVTIDLGTATHLDSFMAIIPQNGCNVALFDTGPLATVNENGRITVSTAAGVRILITEAAPGAATPFVELWVLDDGNNGAGADITGWRLSEYPMGATTDRKVLGDSDNNGVAESTVFVRTGERIVFYDGNVLDEANANGDSIITAGNTGQVFTATDDEVVLYDQTNTPRDAVIWTNRDGTMAADDDFRGVINLAMWKGGIFDTTQNNAVTPRQGTSVGAGYSYQRGGVQDRDTYVDWGEAAATPGALNSIESPCVAPARLAGIQLVDLPDDLGGSLRLTWTPDTSNADFLEYRVYLETYPLRSLLETNVLQRTTISDSRTGTVTISSLVNGDSYYAVVTAVDSWGLEYRFGLSDTGPAVPRNNITGLPRILINEVFAQGNGVADTDYIELYVADDGNPTGNLNLSNWKLYWHSGGSKTFGATTVATGDYLLLTFSSTATDDADSTGDAIVNVWNSNATGLSAGSGYVRLATPADSTADFVFYADRTTALAAALQTAVRSAVDSGVWRGDSVNNSAINGKALDGGFTSMDVFARDGNSSDTTHSRDEWSVTSTRSKGSVNAGVEHPITIPDSRTVRIYRDLANDLGGTLEIGWDTITTLGDFVRYNVYLDTLPIGTRIDTSTRLVPDSTVADSSVGYVAISGLTNGESYYVVVTLTDSWSHEKRIPLTETGPIAPLRNVASNPVMLFTEVKFSNTDTSEFIELRIISDGNGGGPLNLSGFKVAADDTVTGDIISFGSITATDSDYIVLRKASGTSETDSGGDGVINIYNLSFSLPESEEGLFILMPGDTILDFVFWATRDGVLAAGEQTDLAYAVSRGAWNAPSLTDNAGRNPLLYSNFDNDASITRDAVHRDNNGDTDWAIDSPPTPGAAPNIAEAPFAPPAAVSGTLADDLAGDLGGTVRVTWTPVVVADLHHYNIYRETSAIVLSLYTTNRYPRDTAAPNDSSILISGLTNGDTYWFAVTAVDSIGNELKTGLVTDTAVPAVNVTGETLLITEVSFNENSTGVEGHDWVEIYVWNDGNNGAGIDLTGWRIVTSAASDPTKSLTGVTARTGDRLVIRSTTGTDETDSGGDSVINLYWGANTLTATDNSLTLYRSLGDTEDFVAWASPAGAPLNANESRVIPAAVAAGQWTDVGPAGPGTEDGVNSDLASSNWSIARSPDTADVNGISDWVIDSSPTPGVRNDSATLWRVTGTLLLETRSIHGGCTVIAFSGGDTYVAVTNAAGSYVLRVTAGNWTLRGETTQYLRKAVTGIAVTTGSLLNQNIGVMYGGDANGDNMINVFDGSITKYALDRGLNTAAADHVDPIGTVNAVDLQAVRDNFGRRGD